MNYTTSKQKTAQHAMQHNLSSHLSAEAGKSNMVFMSRQQIGLSSIETKWPQLYYLEQIYLTNGRNGCRLYYDNGRIEELAVTLEYMLQVLAGHLQTDLPALRRQSVRLLAGTRSINLPLLLHEQFVLVPVICRKKQRQGDSQQGYVVLQKINGICGSKEGCTITFHTNHCAVSLYNTNRTMKNNLALAVQLQRTWKAGQEAIRTSLASV